MNLFFGGILKVVSMLVLMNIEDINIQGAAISTVVCYAAAGILNMVYLVRKTNMKLNLVDVFAKPIISSAIMGTAVYFTYDLLFAAIDSVTASTLAAVAVGVVVYGVLILVLRMFSPSDLAFIPGGKRLEKVLYRR